jgi:hypothetical protein
MSNTALVIILATLGAAAQLGGVVFVVREIAGDRRRARELVDKQRQWKPPGLRPPRRVSRGQVEARPLPTTSPFHRPAGQQVAAQIASLATGHNQLKHDVEKALGHAVEELLEEIDRGDNELRDVLRYLLRGSAIERTGGVLAILVGIVLSLAATIVGAVG